MIIFKVLVGVFALIGLLSVIVLIMLATSGKDDNYDEFIAERKRKRHG